MTCPTKFTWPPRPTWDEYFENIAQVVATRSTCNRQHVGCVVVNKVDHRILATSYNGAPAGAAHCGVDESLLPEEHCQNALHAEQNLLGYAARAGVSIANADWYLYPIGPCDRCLWLIKATNPNRIIFPTNAV